MAALTTIGFDADDTLWQNEQFFRLTEERFVALLGGHGEAAEISGRLLEAEKRNLGFYGFGIKGFVLSMIETAIEIINDSMANSGATLPSSAVRHSRIASMRRRVRSGACCRAIASISGRTSALISSAPTPVCTHSTSR